MNITIVGAGNIGLQFAVHCREKGHDVVVYTGKKVSDALEIVDENNEVTHSCNGVISSNDPSFCFREADLAFVTYPAFMMGKIAETILPFANSKMSICLVPGTGGGEYYFKNCLGKGATLFGLQRVPSVARIVEPLRRIKCVGYRDMLHVACIPSSRLKDCSSMISSIFDMPVTSVPNYLNITLTPSNPILHTSRLYNLFNDYPDGKIYDRVPLFYEDWNDETSKLLLAMDEELQNVCKAIPLDLSYVKSLKEHYESKNYSEMTRKIRSIKGFKGILTPMVKSGKGYIPDLNSRYFTADFNYGLFILIQIAKLTNVATPKMDMVYDWYKKLSDGGDCFELKRFGVNSLTDLMTFYCR